MKRLGLVAALLVGACAGREPAPPPPLAPPPPPPPAAAPTPAPTATLAEGEVESAPRLPPVEVRRRRAIELLEGRVPDSELLDGD